MKKSEHRNFDGAQTFTGPPHCPATNGAPTFTGEALNICRCMARHAWSFTISRAAAAWPGRTTVPRGREAAAQISNLTHAAPKGPSHRLDIDPCQRCKRKNKPSSQTARKALYDLPRGRHWPGHRQAGPTPRISKRSHAAAIDFPIAWTTATGPLAMRRASRRQGLAHHHSPRAQCSHTKTKASSRSAPGTSRCMARLPTAPSPSRGGPINIGRCVARHAWCFTICRAAAAWPGRTTVPRGREAVTQI